jgi:hypothetical protein
MDPFIETGGSFHTFLSAILTFRIAKLSPDTDIQDWNGTSVIMNLTVLLRIFSNSSK